MEYLVTWIEGEEVQYLFVNKIKLNQLLHCQQYKNCIFTKLQ